MNIDQLICCCGQKRQESVWESQNLKEEWGKLLGDTNEMQWGVCKNDAVLCQNMKMEMATVVLRLEWERGFVLTLCVSTLLSE